MIHKDIEDIRSHEYVTKTLGMILLLISGGGTLLLRSHIENHGDMETAGFELLLGLTLFVGALLLIIGFSLYVKRKRLITKQKKFDTGQ